MKFKSYKHIYTCYFCSVYLNVINIFFKRGKLIIMLLTFQAVMTYWTKNLSIDILIWKQTGVLLKGKTMTTGCTRCRRRMKVYSARLAHRHEKRCVQTIHYNYSKSLKPWKNNIKRNIKSNIMSAWVFCIKTSQRSRIAATSFTVKCYFSV